MSGFTAFMAFVLSAFMCLLLGDSVSVLGSVSLYKEHLWLSF